MIGKEEQRNIYLRSFYTGERLGPLTGKPSIDKPWLIDYTEEEITSSIPKRRIYEDLLDSSKNNLDNVAINYYENKITYRELIENIEKTAAALIHMGVKKGDKVSLLLPYVPETIYLVYAINKIGAIVNMIDPRINSGLIKEYICQADSKFAFVISKADGKLASIKDKTCLEKIVSIKAGSSAKSKIVKASDMFKKSPFTDWCDFLKLGKEKIETAPFNENEIAIIEYTSGTSGNPKGVELSNEALNSLAYFQKQSLKLPIGGKFLLIMPPFIAYGLVIGMHDMLCESQELIMIPNFTLDKAPKMLPKLVKKHHPSSIMGVPNFLSILMNYRGDLSYLKAIIIGGDTLKKSLEEKGKEFLKEHNSPAKILIGWGMTELASCGIFTKNDMDFPSGTIGIPLSKNNCKVLRLNETGKYDIDEEELRYNEEGALFVSSPASTLGYFKREEETKKLFYFDKDGTKWIKTGDVVSIDEFGHVYFKNREKRIVVRPDGHNIPTEQIESVASQSRDVSEAVVIGLESKKYASGSIAAICVEPKNKELSCKDYEQILYDIETRMNATLEPRNRAKCYFAVKNIPYTINGKIDYKALKQIVKAQTDGYNIDVPDGQAIYVVDTSLYAKKKTKKR